MIMFHKFTRIIFITAFVMLVTSCTAPPDLSPPTGMGDPYPAPENDPRIAILTPDLRPWLGFHTAIVLDDGEHPMHVQIPVRNLAEKTYLIDYRILFYDASGFELSPTMGWRMVDLRPKQTARLDGKAMSTDAASWRVEIKWAK